MTLNLVLAIIGIVLSAISLALGIYNHYVLRNQGDLLIAISNLIVEETPEGLVEEFANE